MALHTLILLRHGRTEWNDQRRMQGQRDVPLDDEGCAQARAAAPSIAALGPEAIVTSDLRRAAATAEEMARAIRLTPRPDPRLRETDLGAWEGITRPELERAWPEEWAAWRTEGARVAPPRGEARVDVAARAMAVVDELDAEPLSTALLVTHSGVIVGLTALLLGLPESEWNLFTGIGNCHWVVLDRTPYRWRLSTYNGGLGGVVLPAAEEDMD